MRLTTSVWSPYIELYHRVHYKCGIPAIMFLVAGLKAVRMLNWSSQLSIPKNSAHREEHYVWRYNLNWLWSGLGRDSVRYWLAFKNNMDLD